ncbi:carbohydrate sulfotransferase 11-like isoform X2 [Homarus americanus]|uniref:carbohydrate sulfotransferase 11-like isoform X2 n=1 Tax=Homarus americanus TaxID=6706 RepID=UPI001C438E0E|nr:carbohydrate sulfotransferase 11-like isoform X2 [Homarus americanus]
MIMSRCRIFTLVLISTMLLIGYQTLFLQQPHDIPPLLKAHQIRGGGKGEHTEVQDTRWEAQQQERKAAMLKGCGSEPSEASLLHVLDQHPTLDHLLINDAHQAVFCYIAKVASKTWRKVWANTVGVSAVLKRKHMLQYMVNSLIPDEHRQKSDLIRKVANYTKFLVVRHPFQRLFSAYKDKIQPPNPERDVISVLSYVQKHRFNATRKDIQWQEFVSYIIDGGYRENQHWRPYVMQCYLCDIQYDIIAKYETLFEDSEEILRRIGAPESLHFPDYYPSSTQTELMSYMGKLTQEQTDRLYQIYQQDFELFQYTHNTE